MPLSDMISAMSTIKKALMCAQKMFISLPIGQEGRAVRDFLCVYGVFRIKAAPCQEAFCAFFSSLGRGKLESPYHVTSQYCAFLRGKFIPPRAFE